MRERLHENGRERHEEEEREKQERGGHEAPPESRRVRERGSEPEAAPDHGGRAGPAPRPALQGVDREHEDERRHEEDERDRRGAGRVVLLELRHDEKGGDLGAEGHVARHEHDRAVFAERPREGQREPRQERREEVRKNDAHERLQARGPENGRGLFQLRVEILEDGLDRADDERQAHEREREDDADGREGDLQAERLEETAEPAVTGVDGREREARDGRGEREGKVHDRVHERAPPKAVAGQHPREKEAEDRVEERGGERRPEAQAVGRERARRRHDAKELREREAGRLHEESGERHEDEEADVEKRHAESGPEPGKHSVPAASSHRPG